MIGHPIRVLHVEDSPGDARLLREALKGSRLAFEIECADTMVGGLERLAAGGWDVVLLDLALPDSSGLESVSRVRAAGPDVPIVVLTGLEDEALGLAAVQGGADDYFVKGEVRPALGAMIQRSVRHALERRRLRVQIEARDRQQRAADEALRRSEARYRSLVDGAAYGIFRASAEGKFLQVNPALVVMLGYESEAELLAVDLARDIYQDPDERGRLLERYRDVDRIEGVEVRWRRKDGSSITVRLSGRQLREEGAVQESEMIAEDVTQRRALEDQLRQAQKMDAVGRLAGGVAHDFNNLLQVIMGEAEMALAAPVDEHAVRESLQEIQHAGTSAAALTRQLLAFSRKQVLEHVTFALNDLVSQMDKMLRRLIGEHIEVVTKLAPDAGRVKADRGQLEQVLVNLAVNARDAMPGGGRLLLETANVTLGVDYAAAHADVTPGEYVTLAVSDTGTGMTEEVRSHLFEPFFTTKERDRGTGLGLATSYGIVKQCGGHIAVYSEPGLGTTMRIYLPRVDEPATAGVVKDATSPGGQETILLVEDDGPVRAVAARILAAHGYTVLQAESGEEALRLAEARREPVDLLLTDVVLPGIGARELVGLLKAARPGIAVLFASGYADEMMVRDRLMDGEVVLIQKPFTRDGLARKVREVLDAR